jgi:hypothetical protein
MRAALFEATLSHFKVKVAAHRDTTGGEKSSVERRRATERVIACAVSIAGHGLVVWILAQSLENHPPPTDLPVVEMTLLPPLEPPSPAARPKMATPARPAASNAPTTAVEASAPTLVPMEAQPSAAPAQTLGSGTGPGPAAGEGQGASDRAALDFTCVTAAGKTLTPGQRRKCLGDYSAPASPRDYGALIPADKRAEYDAVARRQARRRQWPSNFGNGASMGCPQANLGSGCLDDMLIPLTGSAAKARK